MLGESMRTFVAGAGCIALTNCAMTGPVDPAPKASPSVVVTETEAPQVRDPSMGPQPRNAPVAMVEVKSLAPPVARNGEIIAEPELSFADEDMQTMLQLHSSWRVRSGRSAMIWSDRLEERARNQAIQMAHSTGQLGYCASTVRQDFTGPGEAVRIEPASLGRMTPIAPHQIVTAWAQGLTGAFDPINATAQTMGCARTSCNDDGAAIWVCRFE